MALSSHSSVPLGFMSDGSISPWQSNSVSMIAPRINGAIISKFDTVELSPEMCPSFVLSANAPHVALQLQSAFNGETSSLQHTLFLNDPVSIDQSMIISTVASQNATSTTRALSTSFLHDSTAVFFHYQSQGSSEPHIAPCSILPHKETRNLGYRRQSGLSYSEDYSCCSSLDLCGRAFKSELQHCDVTASHSTVSHASSMNSKPLGKSDSSNTISTVAAVFSNTPTLEVTSSRFEDGLGPVQAGESPVLRRREKLNREHDQDNNDVSVVTEQEVEMARQQKIKGPQGEMPNASRSNGRLKLNIVEMFMGGLMVTVMGGYVLLV